ncbi:transmembrane protein 183 isoform X1 [Penaeus vannamei]|uniref:transmembrane protein 183 isoform X1 n=2 Tax=Penaeus vannamei TaxID=6689 RepID=UPI000F687FAE|nr:transmembrane protein 183-like isoform X1 [Penaeus vannamei]
MPKNTRKCKKKVKTRQTVTSALSALSDVTVNEFANNQAKRSGHRKQTNVHVIMNEVERLKVAEDDRSWDEKADDDEFDDEYKEGVNDEHGGAGRRRGKRKYSTKETDSDITEGIDLPLDIWFLISEHIRPEDVGRFGAICYATFYVISTGRFWNTLYKRHHRLISQLPEELTIWNMERLRGLKANVIRALFYMYPPFHARIAGEKPLTADPTRLLRTQCVLQWHSKMGSIYRYYFKFSKQMQNKKRLTSAREGLPALMTKDSLIHVNDNEGCYIMEAVASCICAVPMVMGEYLHHAGLGVSADLRSHRLHLSLAPAHLLPSTASAKSRKYQVPYKEVMLEPVRDVRVYPWWHPQYWKCGR